MAKWPAFQFYTGDWLKDPKLGQCRPATRGIWMDLLCLMHENHRSGIITGTTESLARVCRCTQAELTRALKELKATETATVTDRNNVITVCNRRMREEAKTRADNALRQRKHRGKRESNKNITPYSSSSPSSSPSDHLQERDEKPSPESDLLNAWPQIQADAGLPMDAIPDVARSTKLSGEDWLPAFKETLRWALERYGGYDALRARLLELVKAHAAGEGKIYSLKSLLTNAEAMGGGKEYHGKVNRTKEEYDDLPDWAKK